MDRDRKQKIPRHLKENAGRLVGWRFALLFGGFAGAITAFLYPMVIQPIINPESSEYWKSKYIHSTTYFTTCEVFRIIVHGRLV